MPTTIRLQEKHFDEDLGELCSIQVSPSSRYFALNAIDKIVIFDYDTNLTISPIECDHHHKFIKNLFLRQTSILPEKFNKRSVGEFNPKNLTAELEFRMHITARDVKFMKFNFSPNICGKEYLGVLTDDYEFNIHRQMGGKSQKWTVISNISQLLYDKVQDSWQTGVESIKEYYKRRSSFEVSEFCWNSRVQSNTLELAAATRDGIIHFANLTLSDGVCDIQLSNKQVHYDDCFVDRLHLSNDYLVSQSSNGKIVLFDMVQNATHVIWSQKDNFPSYGLGYMEHESFIDIFFNKPGTIYRKSFYKDEKSIIQNVLYNIPDKKCMKNLIQHKNTIYITFPDSADFTCFDISQLCDPKQANNQVIIASASREQILDSDEVEHISLYGIAQSSNSLIKAAVFARNTFCYLTDKPNNIKILFFTNKDICDIFSVLSENLRNNTCEHYHVNLYLYRQAVYQAFSSDRYFIAMQQFFNEFVAKFFKMELKNILKMDLLFLKFARNLGLRLVEYCDIFGMPLKVLDKSSVELIIEKLEVAILKIVSNDWLSNSQIHLNQKRVLMFGDGKIATLEQIVSLYNIDSLRDLPLGNLSKNIRQLIKNVIHSKMSEALGVYQACLFEVNDKSSLEMSVKDYFNRCPICDRLIPEVKLSFDCPNVFEYDVHHIKPCCNSLVFPRLNMEWTECYSCKNNYLFQDAIWSVSDFQDKCFYCL